MSRIAAALNSDDLSHREHDCDSDVLKATGFASVRRSLGVLIVQAKEGCAGDGPHAAARIKDLEHALRHQVKRVARRWRIAVEVDGVAAQITKELILDRCGVCQGRGFIPMKYDGTRFVAVVVDQDDSAKDVECHTCLGSGAARRDYHGRAKSAGFKDYNKQLGEWWEAVLQSCCDAEVNARAEIWKRLNRHI